MSEENKKSYHWDSGKGSRPRSYSVTQEEFGKNWDAIFGKKKTEEVEVLKVDKLSSIGSGPGIITTGSIDVNGSLHWKIDAEGNIIKESGCSTVASESPEAAEG